MAVVEEWTCCENKATGVHCGKGQSFFAVKLVLAFGYRAILRHD